MSGGIFISYRREDIRQAAKTLVDRLGEVYGPQQLYIGSDAIEPRPPFFEASGRKIERSHVLLALIGPDWLEARDRSGRRRLDDPSDFVRQEIETALDRSIHVVPILLDGASLPAEQDLPDSLRPLARNGAVALAHERFAADADGLVKALAEAIPPQHEPPPLPDRAANAPRAPARAAGSRPLEWVHLPSVTLAALGLVSGILSLLWGFGPTQTDYSAMMPKLEWLEPIGGFFWINPNYVPVGFFFGSALALGIWLWTRNWWSLLVVPVGTMCAWSLAVMAAALATLRGYEVAAGPLAGAIGAVLTHLYSGFVSPALRRAKWIALSFAVGAVAGLAYVPVQQETVNGLLLYVAWQPIVAFSLGMGLGRPKTAGAGLPLSTYAYIILALPIALVLFERLTSALSSLVDDPLNKEIAAAAIALLVAGVGVALRRWKGLATARAEVAACWIGGAAPILVMASLLAYTVERWSFLGSRRAAWAAGVGALAALALMSFDLYRHGRARAAATRRV